MTDESASQTEPWIEEHGAEFAYAYDKGGKLAREIGITALPTAMLIDAAGTIQWVGSPSSVNASMLEKHLAGAISKPLWEWPKEAKKVKKAVLKNTLGKALAEAEKLGESHADIKASVRSLIDGKLSAFQKANEEKDWLRVSDSGAGLKKAFAGLPEQETVKTILDTLKGDKDAQAVLGGQRKVDKLMKSDFKRKDIPKMEKQLKSIAEKHTGTAAERDAQAALKKLSGMKRK